MASSGVSFGWLVVDLLVGRCADGEVRKCSREVWSYATMLFVDSIQSIARSFFEQVHVSTK